MVHLIDTPGNVAGQFNPGNPFAGISATEVGAAWLNTQQLEGKNLVEGAGLTMSKTNNAQVLEAVQILAGAGLSANQVSHLNSARGMGSPIAGEFRRALDTIRCQEIATDSGFRVPRLRAMDYQIPLGSATVPARYFEHGGTIKIEARGWCRPGSANTIVGLSLSTDGDLIRPRGNFGGVGLLAFNSTVGTGQILRLANSCDPDLAPAVATLPFRVDVTIEVLGQHAAHPNGWVGPGHTDEGDGNTLVHGEIVFEFPRNLLAVAGPINETHWDNSTTWAKDGTIVSHLGQKWLSAGAHAGVEPGVDADWWRYWIPRTLRVEWDFVNQIDWETEREFLIDVPSAYNGNPAPSSAWASGSTYSVGNTVLHGGFEWMCMEAISPADANAEPGDSSGAKDGERYWERLHLYQGDEIHYSRVSAWFKGGAEGAGALL